MATNVPTPAALNLDLLDARNEDVVRPGFGTSREVLRIRWRNRTQRGRVRVQPGYTLHRRDAGQDRLTAPWVAEHWYGEPAAQA